MIEHRKALAERGLIKEAQDLDKMIKRSARDDKEEWIKGRLEDKFWEPIKEFSRSMAPQVVALKRGGKKEAGRAPAEVYAEFLEEEQWGRQNAGDGHEREQPQPPDWGTDPIAAGTGAGQVKEGPIEMEELERAVQAASRGKAPGPDDIPVEAWAAMGQEGRGHCWNCSTGVGKRRNSRSNGRKRRW